MRTSTSTTRSSPRSTADRRRILGIDPGSLATGYGIIAVGGPSASLVAAGVIRNDPSSPMVDRLLRIHEALCELIRRHRPDEAAIETAFYGRNAQSALKLGHARGVAMLAAAGGGLGIAEYSPREVKKAVTGNGNASKRQVQMMIRSVLGPDAPPAGFDASDALAAALCHAHRPVPGGAGHRDWKAYLIAHPERLRQAGGGR